MNGSPSPYEPQRLRVVYPRQPLPSDPALRHLALSTRGEELRRRGEQIARLRLQAERDARDEWRALVFACAAVAFVLVGLGVIAWFGDVSVAGF